MSLLYCIKCFDGIKLYSMCCCFFLFSYYFFFCSKGPWILMLCIFLVYQFLHYLFEFFCYQWECLENCICWTGNCNYSLRTWSIRYVNLCARLLLKMGNKNAKPNRLNVRIYCMHVIKQCWSYWQFYHSQWSWLLHWLLTVEIKTILQVS